MSGYVGSYGKLPKRWVGWVEPRHDPPVGAFHAVTGGSQTQVERAPTTNHAVPKKGKGR